MNTDTPTAYPFRDPSLPTDERIADLLGRMTLDEKISQLTTESPPIDRLGVPHFVWGGECLHGICNRGEATQFPMPIGMAASFDPELLQAIADAIGDEARARHHDPDWRGPDGPWVGLTYFTPVINILRDPRWGRAQETYGEDPLLTSRLGAAFVRGLQGDDPAYLKAAACAKHLAVHSGPERLRQRFNARVSRKDLVETYLPAFKALSEAGAATVMATYNRVNDEHCCGSKTLIGEFLRGQFEFDGMVLSDGGALGSLHTTHAMTTDAVETAGLCLSNGCDMEIGTNAYPHAAEAIERGLITEADIDRAVSRILKVRFQVGDFDPPENVPYTSTPRDIVRCDKHIALARQMATESIVLLKNDGILPLSSQQKSILVTGPTAADAVVLLGNFYRGASPDLRTIFEGTVKAAPNGMVVTFSQGCFLTHPNVFESDWTFGLANWADAIVVCLGYSPLMEGEQGECIGAPDGGDKAGIDIPSNQLDFLRRMKDEGKPIVAVVTGGSPLALEEVHELADAVVMAWYPGEQGGMAVGDILFGHAAPSGKLPVTFPKSLDQVPDYEDYNLQGRTYRYMTDTPMYPFGFGLSYTSFEYSDLSLSSNTISADETVEALITVRNAGEIGADEVVQLYLTDEEASVTVPRWALKDFRRLHMAPGESATVTFEIDPSMLELINEDGEAVLEPGTFTVTIGGSSPDPRCRELGAPEVVTAQFRVE